MLPLPTLFVVSLLSFYMSPSPTDIYTLSLHDALPICYMGGAIATHLRVGDPYFVQFGLGVLLWLGLYLRDRRDRKSTRLNSSHLGISYAVFCLKKKK